MILDSICKLIKYTGIYIGLGICFLNIINYTKRINLFKKIIIITSSIALSCFQCFIINYVPLFLVYLALTFLYGVILSKMTNTELTDSFVYSVISLSISYTVSLIPCIIGSIIFASTNFGAVEILL